ncbi:DNA cytosine methyltransferase [Bradyrhizobium sp. dw_78]|uniref:DNA cytosine methyltransferase n=1 Tax=Bradyrhizobium sp. dw_78 TaxID=2719793 RepID=UPI001BD27D78|nr:DNA cytosine methyltransferase [Bradyrhizobium sp. dw_78]
MKHNDKVISLFSGAGGMSLGFAGAGLKPVIAADVDRDACATYQANLGDGSHCIDLADLDPRFEKELDGKTGAFALIGGPPCQGFSSAGAKSGLDQRNRLIFNYFSIVERVRPRWFLFENVEGLLTSNEGHSVVALVRKFISIGYRVRLEKVNFASYGLPQARKRILIIGNSLGLDFEFPRSTHSYNAGKHQALSHLPFAPPLMDALAGLGSAAQKNGEIVPYVGPPQTRYDAAMRSGNSSGGVDQHAIEGLSSVSQEIAKHLAEGQTMKDLPEAMWHESYRRRANRRVMDGTPTERRGGAPSGLKRLVAALNSLTITSAATREFLHPLEDRPLTLREAARLQSFPDKFKFHGTTRSIAQQIGNAFPPLAAEVLANHLASLDGAAGADLVRSPAAGGLVDFHLTNASGKSPALSKTERMLATLSENQTGMSFVPAEASTV